MTTGPTATGPATTAPTTTGPTGHGPRGTADRPARVVLVDDSALFRHSVAQLLAASGLDVVGELGDLEALPAVLAAQSPDVCLLDVRLPPTHTDEGIRAALRIRRDHPAVGVLILSTYADGAWARALFADGSAGLGYLLKDRVDDVQLVEGIHRVAARGTVVDPDVVSGLLGTRQASGPLESLSARERDVLRLMAEGRSNAGIGRALFISPRTVEAYVNAVFSKLALDAQDSTANRRVLAVLAFLDGGTPHRP